MMSLQSTASPFATAKQFLMALAARNLISQEQVAQIDSSLGGEGIDPAALADRLVDQGLLTRFQVEQLFQDEGETLNLGQYRLLDRLGAGGMGQVFKAEHILMKRVVALKIIAAPLLPDPWAVERFHREIQAAARLWHPNVVAALDAAEDQGQHFLVMEYVDGTDLHHLVKQGGPLPIALACEYIRQAALGLQHAHEHGLVHCDIKPANLMVCGGVTSGGAASGDDIFSPTTHHSPLTTHQIKILDLGLAHLAGKARVKPEPAPGGGPSSSCWMGTPDFMAPEVGLDPNAADIRSDLYSLGCTFYYLLTGKTPFPGETWPEKLLQHQLDPATPVTEGRPDIPPEVADLLHHRLLAKDPAQRYQTPAELVEALRPWAAAAAGLQSLPLPASPSAVNTPLPQRKLTLRGLVRPPGADRGPPPLLRASRRPPRLPMRGARPRPGRKFPSVLAVTAAVTIGLAVAWLWPRSSPKPPVRSTPDRAVPPSPGRSK
jgi:serine/threonine-protein kinase